MKKLITLIITIFMTFSFCVLPAHATESESAPDIIFKDTISGQLISDDGDVVQVTGYRRDTPSTISLDSNMQAVTYDYTISVNDRNHADTVSGSDSTGYLSASMTLYYTEHDITPTEYTLNGVSGTWNDPDTSDGTNVSTTANISAICYGLGTNNAWRDQQIVGTITSGSYLATGFQYSMQSYYGVMGATMSLGISQGITRQWTLELECYPIEGNV